MPIDPRKLRPSELCRLVNSTPLGEVLSERQLHRHRSRAGLRIGDARHVDLVRYVAWLVQLRHTPRPEPECDPYQTLKDRARARNIALSLAGRDIGELPAVVDAARKEKAASDFRFFCETYFPLTFHLPWSRDHLKVIARIEQAVLRGGLFALAMPRGSGKSTICECACIWAVLYGHREFVCLIGSDEGHAMDMLDSIKMELDGNDLLLEDFPEVVYPIQCLDGIANRCNGQLYKGERTHIGWTAREIVLPTIPGSKASGAIIKVAGITGRIRGMKYKRADGKTVRPTLVVLENRFMPMEFSRRRFLAACGAVMGPWALRALRAEPQATDPLAVYKLAWTGKIRWGTIVEFVQVPGATNDEKLRNAIALAAMKGGGVVQFPAGTFRFTDSIILADGVVLRGADPRGVTRAHNDKYAPPTIFEFPKYEAQLEGDGTDIRKAFKGVYLAEPAEASNVGVLNIAFNRGHIHFADGGAAAKFTAGVNRFVVGCVFRNAAVADPNVPNRKVGQKAWQRFTARHHAAIDIKSAENLLVANNRLPPSGDDNFTMNGYVLTKGRETITIDGVVFDYDNRPGLYVNHYSIGGAGGMGPDGTPESHPHGFRSGIVIADNFIFNTGRMGIGFCGDGVRCINNIIRMPDNIWRPTTTGIAATTGSSTNDNRAIEMRGWRWVVDGNEYTVHRNWALDKKYKINDGEGLMHEDHVNSTIRDSVLTNNRGNTYLSLYKCAGIDGLLIEGNDIQLGDGPQTIASGAAIYVNADRNSGRFPARRVRIVKNTVRGGGILLSGDPSEKNEIRGNKHIGTGPAKITLKANAEVADNSGFDVEKGP